MRKTILILLALSATPALADRPAKPCYNPYVGVCESPYVARDFGQDGLTLARAEAVVRFERARERSPEWITLLWERAWREGGGFGGGGGDAGAAGGVGAE